MPTYEFRCPLGHEFEKFYRAISTAEAQTACPTCGAVAERIMSRAGFAFKGSGFYLTDYGKNAHRDRGGSGAKSEGDTGDNARSDGAKPEGSSGDAKAESKAAGSDAAPASAEEKKVETKAAEPKPAAPSKKSSDE